MQWNIYNEQALIEYVAMNMCVRMDVLIYNHILSPETKTKTI